MLTSQSQNSNLVSPGGVNESRYTYQARDREYLGAVRKNVPEPISMGGVQKADNTEGIETSRFNANQESRDEIQRVAGQNKPKKDEREND